MAAASVTITVSVPTSEKQVQEVFHIARALDLAAHDIRSGGGLKTSGTMLGTGAVSLGTWSYTAGAGS